MRTATLRASFTSDTGGPDLPLDPAEPNHTARVGSLVSSVAPVGDLDPDQLAAWLNASIAELRSTGLRMIGRIDAATVAVAVSELTAPGIVDDLFADRAADALRDDAVGRRPHADTRRIDLPCGPAVASLVFGQFDLPPEETGAGEIITIPTFRAEILVPTPEWDGIVVLDVSTTDEDSWPEVSREAVRLARSLRFLDAGEPLREGEHLLRL